LVGYAYSLEFFIAWYSGNPAETFIFVNRAFGPYAWAYWIMFSCNVITPQLIWFRRVRQSAAVLFVLSIFVNIGMWFERFVIVATSLHRDFLPSSWDYFTPTLWDWTTLIGSFGLFFTLFCLFLRYLPVIAMAEAKAVMPIANPHYHPPHGDDDDPSGPSSRASSGVVDSQHDLDDDRKSGAVSHEVSSGGSAKVVVSKADDPDPEKPDKADVKVEKAAAKVEKAEAKVEKSTAQVAKSEEQASKAEPSGDKSDFVFAPPPTGDDDKADDDKEKGDG
jgi:hypothetical protein